MEEDKFVRRLVADITVNNLTELYRITYPKIFTISVGDDGSVDSFYVVESMITSSTYIEELDLILAEKTRIKFLLLNDSTWDIQNSEPTGIFHFFYEAI